MSNNLMAGKRGLIMGLANDKSIAWGIAQEWESQGNMMRPDTMPMMKLATTAVDQVPDIRPTMMDSMLRCLKVLPHLAHLRSVFSW